MTTQRRRDWTLLAVAAPGRAPLTPAQLQKILFLLGERQKLGDFVAALAPEDE
jgi:hypothetical protein